MHDVKSEFRGSKVCILMAKALEAAKHETMSRLLEEMLNINDSVDRLFFVQNDPKVTKNGVVLG